VTLSGLFRLNGFALVLAAVVFAVAEVISFSIFAQGGDYDLAEVARSGAFFLQSFLTLFAGTLLLGGSVGFYLGQSEAAGRLGLVGFLPCVIYSPDLTEVYGTHPGYNAP
jgi:hypothetical protein